MAEKVAEKKCEAVGGVESLLQTHNDLVLAIHKSLFDVYASVQCNVEILTKEVKEIKESVSAAIGDQKYFFDKQEQRHAAEIERLMALMTMSGASSSRRMKTSERDNRVNAAATKAGTSSSSAGGFVPAHATKKNETKPPASTETPKMNTESGAKPAIAAGSAFASSTNNAGAHAKPFSSAGTGFVSFNATSGAETKPFAPAIGGFTSSTTNVGKETKQFGAPKPIMESVTKPLFSTGSGFASPKTNAGVDTKAFAALETPKTSTESATKPLFSAGSGFASPKTNADVERKTEMLAGSFFTPSAGISDPTAAVKPSPPLFGAAFAQTKANAAAGETTKAAAAPLGSFFTPSKSTTSKSNDEKKQETPANAAKLPTPSSTTFGGGALFGGAASSGASFASVASKTPNFNFLTPKQTTITPDNNTAKNSIPATSVFGDPKNFQIFQQKPVVSPAAAASAADARGNESGGEEDEFVPDAHFEPVIPLPALVETKTGEEDEEVLFVSRCKLYRFDRETKENKERGVGEIKILKHKHTGRYRCLMRRDQVLKLCANFYISAGMKISPKPNLPTVYTWACKDYSQDSEWSDEVFCARFKEAVSAEEFCKKFREAAAASPSATTPSSGAAQATTATNAGAPAALAGAKSKTEGKKAETPIAAAQQPKFPTTFGGGALFGASAGAPPTFASAASKMPNFSFVARTCTTTPTTVATASGGGASPFPSASKTTSAFVGVGDVKKAQADSSYADDEEEDDDDGAEDDGEDDDDDYENVNYEDEEDKLLIEEECDLTTADAFVSPMKQNSANKTGPVKCTLRVFESSGVIYMTFTDPKDPQNPLFTHYVYKRSNYAKKSTVSVEYTALHSTTSVTKQVTLAFLDAEALSRFTGHFDDGVAVAQELDFDESE